MIITHNSDQWSVLATQSQLCTFPLSQEDITCIESLNKELDLLKNDAAAIAAIQIGYAKRIFVIQDTREVFINPVILSKSRVTRRLPEGCLSIPGFSVRISRPKKIELQYFSIDGTMQQKTFSGFQAQVMSHELDHLEGKLIIDHLKEAPRSSKKTDQKIKAIHKRREKNKRAKKARALNR